MDTESSGCTSSAQVMVEGEADLLHKLTSKELMRLPLDKRREIMREQAETSFWSEFE